MWIAWATVFNVRRITYPPVVQIPYIYTGDPSLSIRAISKAGSELLFEAITEVYAELDQQKALEAIVRVGWRICLLLVNVTQLFGFNIWVIRADPQAQQAQIWLTIAFKK